jgi:predicted nucleic acid-binding protein
VDYLIRRRAGAQAARRFLRDIAEGRFQVECLTPGEHGVDLELDQRYASLDLGLADLSIVILTHRLRTRRLLTFDERDFHAVKPLAGGHFTLLPHDA